MTDRLNQDPIEIVGVDYVSDTEVVVRLKLSKRDHAMIVQGSIGDFSIDRCPVDGGPVGEAAENGRDIEAMRHSITARMPFDRSLYEGTWAPLERCPATSDMEGTDYRCHLPVSHRSGHTYVESLPMEPRPPCDESFQALKYTTTPPSLEWLPCTRDKGHEGGHLSHTRKEQP